MTSSGARPINFESGTTASTPLARVFNVQRYSLNDGEGIRTLVFFKGCPLRCPWCSNPESRSREAVFVRREAKCIHCEVCEEDVVECPTRAYQRVGTEYTVDGLLSEVLKDEVFFRASGGGVTLSGGEVLLQAGFAIELLDRLKALGISTAVETTGHGNSTRLLEMAKRCDEVLFDFKIMDAVRAHEVIGLNLQRVLANFAMLVANGVHVIPRVPLIPGYTMDETNLASILQFLKPFPGRELHLLPFHQYGSSKYELIGMPYGMAGVQPPSDEEVERCADLFRREGFAVVLGG